MDKIQKLINEAIVSTLSEKFAECSIAVSSLQGNTYTAQIKLGGRSVKTAVLIYRCPDKQADAYWLTVGEETFIAAEDVLLEDRADSVYIGVLGDSLQQVVLLPILRKAKYDVGENAIHITSPGYIESHDESGNKLYTFPRKGPSMHNQGPEI